jgi:N-acetylmuramoyl-L-alanine amidase/V8-like Glu-specific endopeptidase
MLHGKCHRKPSKVTEPERVTMPDGPGSNDRFVTVRARSPTQIRAQRDGTRRAARIRGGPMARIIIDAGHGGSARVGSSSAYGSRGPNGTLEKDVTLDIARHVVARLGAGAALTRRDDINLSLGSRAAHAQRDGADVFVSIHANSGAPEMSGPETWVHPDAGDRSHRLAGGIQAALERLGGRYGGSAESRRGPMAVLSPAVLGRRTSACLVEVDYLSSSRGEQRLRDPGERARIGAAIADAIKDHVARYGDAAADEFASKQGGSVRMPPPPILNQVRRAHGLIGSLASRATDTSLGFGVRGDSGRVLLLISTVVPEGATNRTCTVRVRNASGTVLDRTLEMQTGSHHHLERMYLDVTDGDYTIEIVNNSNSAVRFDVELTWHAATIQGRRFGRTAVALDRPSPDPFIIPDPGSYRGQGLIQFVRVWADWFGHYARWRSGVPAEAYPSFPHSAICELELTLDNGGRGYGTGFYIGPETILTCGHNFRMGSRHTTNVMVRPGKSPYQSIFPERAFAIPNWRDVVHPNWAASQDFDWDMAVFHTPGLPAPNNNYFTLPNMTPNQDQNIVVCGYGKFRGDSVPASDEGQTMDGGHITSATEHQYHFPIQAIPGHSGSPVFWNDMVIAILTGPRMLGANNAAPLSDYENRGVRLTPEKLDWITSR